MAKRMLIDATHPEETRVVVVNGTRLEELDVETSSKRQLKGNIYLAKVVRVEPSLQAAFVDYGGNRHGFLAFSEIHPDYFQIPVADRQALLDAQKAVSDKNEEQAALADAAENGESVEANADSGDQAQDSGVAGEGNDEEAPKPENLGGDDSSEQDLERKRARLLRNYKIQEVIKRRQIMLVQVVKEERGNKGAALTTYLSLAGRYCVLMPNTARGGGVSRKITNATDRRRLKSIANELECPDGMAVIVRTAGSERSKTEIKRDYEYLLRAWDNVRSATLSSAAPALVYEEASLIKRSIRDLYSRDIDEVLVEGDEGYRLAKDYMRMLTPSHAKKVQPYKDPVIPLFHRFQVEIQLDAMHSPVVQLKSGGYIVINQTEALVAIDVNSGRATKERHIEETAVKTNLEAADEISRQLRLRDLAGLIVIDFIDMEEGRNNHAVERRLKEALKNDRARIQVGKISAFGLLELSRQRLRPSLQETTFGQCPHCAGTGLVRSVESAAVLVLRQIEEEGIRGRSSEITVWVPTQVALYILNQKRDTLADIEMRYQFRVFVAGDDSLIPPAIRMDRVKAENRPEFPRPSIIDMSPTVVVDDEDDIEDEDEEEGAAEATEANANSSSETEEENNEQRRNKRRRRRRKRRGDQNDTQNASSEDDNAEEGNESEDQNSDNQSEGTDSEGQESDADGDADDNEEGEFDANGERRKRRRGRRGGRRRRRGREDGENDQPQSDGSDQTDGVESDAERQSPAPQSHPAYAASRPYQQQRRQAPAVPGMELLRNPDAVADVFAQYEAMEEARAAAPVTAPATVINVPITKVEPVETAVAEQSVAEPVAESLDAAEEVAAKPKRTRKAPAKKAEDGETAEKPKRTRAKKADADGETTEKPKRSRAKKADADAATAEGEVTKPKRTRAKKASVAEEVAPETASASPVAEQVAPVVHADSVVTAPVAAVPEMTEAATNPEPEPQAPKGPARKGWWAKKD